MPRCLMPLVLAVAIPATVFGQEATARLQGKVLSISSGQPVAGVIVSIPAAHTFASSDSTGAFAIDSLPAGVTAVRVVQLGRPSRDYQFTLRAGHVKRIEVLVDTRAIELEPIVARASHLDSRWGMLGFYARMHSGFGDFITRETIERRGFRSLWQPLTGLGIGHGCVGSRGCGPTIVTRGRRCLMGVYVNGIAGFGEDVDVLDPSEVAGIEIYRAGLFAPWEIAASHPMLASSGFLGGTPLAGCGSVIIWTRDWRSDFAPDR